MGYRPYPDADRARHQVERSRLRPYHYVRRLPDGVIAETHIFPKTDAIERAFRALMASAQATVQRVADRHTHKFGETSLITATTTEAVKAGEAIHVATRRGVRCAGGAEHACTLLPLRPDTPLLIARAVRTCLAAPSQWNAWT
ncbi:hypothetical protein KMT30_45830, partial [Streptomyces sp. IBSBF 2953]|nr:hypothetical protein [Streptomyces hayashii]